MTKAATIAPVSRPRGKLTEKQFDDLMRLKAEAQIAQAFYRNEVVYVLESGASFAEVAKATGLSTNTLQRWKREAQS